MIFWKNNFVNKYYKIKSLDKKYEVQKNKKGVKFFKMGKRIKKIFFNGEEYPPETFRLGMMLCMVGGFMDTYTFSTRGNVLANAQTGNIVFLAINIHYHTPYKH